MALVIALAGCRGTDEAVGLGDSLFVRTMVRLETINRDSSLDSAARADARRDVLRRTGLTAGELEAAARAMAADPEHALDVWTAIDQGVKRERTPPPT